MEVLYTLLQSIAQLVNPNQFTWSLFCLGNLLFLFFAWNNHPKILGKFDFYFFYVNNIFLGKKILSKKNFFYCQKGLRPFFGSKSNFLWKKSIVHILSNFPKNFWRLFQAKNGKIWLPRQKWLQVNWLLIFWR